MMFERSASLIAVSTVLGVLASVAVVLRFVARYIKGLRIWIDDYLVLTALILTWGVCISNIVGASVARFGNHEIFQTTGPQQGHPIPELMVLYGKICFACRLLHATAMQLLKVALLLFYRRIFDQNRRFRVVFWTMMAYVGLWWLICFWLNLFTCYPISWSWSPSPEMPEHCLPHYHLFFSYAALTNLISDVIIAVIPFPFLFGLRMCIMKKLAISGMLLTGAIVIVAGIGRTYAFFTVGHSLDYTYENYDYLIWSSVEPCVGVIGCCLPTFRPLFTHNADSACARSYTRYSDRGYAPRHSQRPMSGTEAVMHPSPVASKERAMQHQGTFLSQSSTSDDSGDLSASGNPIALFNATPKLGETSSSREPFRQYSVSDDMDTIGSAC